MSDQKETVIGQGQTLFRQGEKGGDLYFIKEGRVELTVRDEDTGETAVVGVSGDRSVLGTMSFLEGDPRSATAVAKSEVKAVIIKSMQREKLLSTVPQWFRVLVNDLSQSLRRLNTEYTRLRTEHELLKKRFEVMKKKVEEEKAEAEKENAAA